MKILLLAPHPFFQERGTPIDVLLVLRVLSARPDTQVDVLAYHEGDAVELHNVRIHRIRAPFFIRGIRPGFSMKKIFCDVLMLFAAWGMARRGGYDLVHAGEEAVFIAMLLKRAMGIPYAYDLDSSIAQQIVESRPLLAPFRRWFERMERAAIRGALICFPVCVALEDLCRSAGARRTVTLHDISQLAHAGPSSTGRLREELGIRGMLILYTGNLEPYQGVDLLLESFRMAARDIRDLSLAVIGGAGDDVTTYRRKAEQMGLKGRCHIVGPRPFADLDSYLAEADIVVCPRIRGVNTPMKVFPYLHSGRPLLATDLATHNQILTQREALLVPANPRDFAAGMIRLARDPQLRARLGESGRAFVEAGHVFEAHRRRLVDAYDWIAQETGQA
jgi:glycosyltransferase involved in cell wall biosynthesis